MEEKNKRAVVTAVLEGEKPDIIPCWYEGPMDVTVRKILPAFKGDWVEDGITFARFFDNYVVGSPGISFNTKTLSRDESHHLYRYETGAVWREKYNPTFCREAVSYPINTIEDIAGFVMPDVSSPERFCEESTRQIVKSFQKAGYFVEGSVMGVWYGIYYFLTSFENILTWMAVEPEAAHRLFDMVSRFSLESARRVLSCGVDCIFTASDLGSGNGLLFSPRMFEEFVFPWLKKLSDLCHEHGAYLHLHSHGHIEDLMERIVEAGADIVNPIGPSDNNDLELFKERWGDRITLNGGISTKIAQMSEEQLQQHIKKVIETGRKGGRFFPRTESGIPPMPAEKVLLYMNLLKKERAYGYE